MPRGRSKKSANDAQSSAQAAKPEKRNGNGGNLGFEAQLFLAADKLRKNLEPSDYKHVALGLIFLKHISNVPLPSEGIHAGRDLCPSINRRQGSRPREPAS
jgi:hypothetical protein